MARTYKISDGPDRLALAHASVGFGDEAMVSFYTHSSGQFDMFVQSVVKGRTVGEVTVVGRTGAWRHVPMGHGQSYRDPLERATIKYDLVARRGELVFSK